LMVGTELAIAAFVHPALDRLPDDVHLPAVSSLARVLGTVMPVWYPLVLVLSLAEAILEWRRSGHPSIWLATSAILWILASVYSLTSLVPINTRIASWEKSTPPADWKTYRNRWDLLHRWRVALLTMAFAFLIVGVVSRWSSVAFPQGSEMERSPKKRIRLTDRRRTGGPETPRSSGPPAF
jgi:uncharacterized membrane protein